MKFLSEHTTFSIYFTVGSLGGTTYIRTTFDLVSRRLKHVCGYCSHNFPYAALQVLKVVDRNLVDNFT
jgi:hypothetical protein